MIACPQRIARPKVADASEDLAGPWTDVLLINTGTRPAPESEPTILSMPVWLKKPATLDLTQFRIMTSLVARSTLS